MAFPNAVTAVRGVMDTADHISYEKPLAISDKIWTHDPNANKGLSWFLHHGLPKERTTRKEWYHLEDPPSANWVEYAGAAEGSQATTGVVLASGHGARITIGSRIYWPRTEEIMRLTAVMSTDTTGAVTRNSGRGVAATSLLKPGDRGLIMIPSFEEGFTTPGGLGQNMVYKTFRTTTLSLPVEVTDENIAEANYGGNPFARQLGKQIKNGKNQSEAELYFGGTVSDTSGTHPRTTSVGLANYITTHTYSATKISRMDLWDILTEHSMTYDGPLTLHGSTYWWSLISMWALEKTEYTINVGKDGMRVKRVMTPVGTYDFIKVDVLNQHPLLAGMLFGCPPGRFQYKYLSGHGKNLDVKYQPLPEPSLHKEWGEIVGVRGFEFFEEETYFKLEGVRVAA